MTSTFNLFANSDPPSTGERLEPLLDDGSVLIERIVSSADNPPVDYLQHHDEWVTLLTGEARLTVAGAPVALVAGDCLHIPAGTPHRVESTSDGALWLAVHYNRPPA